MKQIILLTLSIHNISDRQLNRSAWFNGREALEICKILNVVYFTQRTTQCRWTDGDEAFILRNKNGRKIKENWTPCSHLGELNWTEPNYPLPLVFLDECDTMHMRLISMELEFWRQSVFRYHWDNTHPSVSVRKTMHKVFSVVLIT